MVNMKVWVLVHRGFGFAHGYAPQVVVGAPNMSYQFGAWEVSRGGNFWMPAGWDIQSAGIAINPAGQRLGYQV